MKTYYPIIFRDAFRIKEIQIHDYARVNCAVTPVTILTLLFSRKLAEICVRANRNRFPLTLPQQGYTQCFITLLRISYLSVQFGFLDFLVRYNVRIRSNLVFVGWRNGVSHCVFPVEKNTNSEFHVSRFFHQLPCCVIYNFFFAIVLYNYDFNT